MSRKLKKFNAACAGLIAFVIPCGENGRAEQAACAVAITSPRDGVSVGANENVEGTATIPPGKYLWVFAHRKGLQGWWPQGNGPAATTGGKWTVTVTFGEPRDISRDFEVAATVLENSDNARLMAWFQRANETGNYPPVAFPSPSTDCSVARLTVRKAS